MICGVTGEIRFNGLTLRRHQLIDEARVAFEALFPCEIRPDSPHPDFTTLVPARPCPSAYGNFHLECTFEPSQHLVLITVSHEHRYYEPGTPGDAERQIFHESIIAKDLGGQREFGWGEILDFFCEVEQRHHIGILYTPGPGVPLHPVPRPRELLTAKIPDESG